MGTDQHIDGTMELDPASKTLAPELNQRAVLHAINDKHQPVKTTTTKTTTLWLKPNRGQDGEAWSRSGNSSKTGSVRTSSWLE